VIAIAEIQRRYLIEEENVPPHKLAVIHNGIPIDSPDSAERVRRRRAIREEMKVPEMAHIVGITAVLRPEKNHQLLLDAFSRLRESLHDAELWIIGDGPERASLQETASRLRLHEAVRFLGHRPDARRLLAALDVAVLSSHPRVETLPLSLLEAMDAGLPVVATRVGALEEMVRDGRSGFLVPQGDARALAEALLQILGDRSLGARMGEEGQAICREGFSVERMVNETAQLLCGLLEIPKGVWAGA
jgi:glycosyltransferase involved in cell wall biosynthesis